jgi:MFS family permease
MTKHFNRTIRKIYLYRSLIDFILLYPLYSILFANHGLSTLQISTLFIIWALTDIITNVPLGVLADKFPRKWLLALGPLIEAAGFFVWFALPTYDGFAAGFILWGISWAIIDGTFEAFLYDELKAASMENKYVRIAGRAGSFALISNFAATVIASLAILLGYGFVTGASIAALIFACATALTLPDTKRIENVDNTKYFAMLSEGIQEAIHNRVLLEVILLGSIIGSIYGSLDEYTPLFFHQVGYSRSIVALIVAATILAAALGSFIAHRYEHFGARSFMLLLLLSGILLIGTARLLGLSAIILMIIFTFIIKLLGTVYDGKVQHSITGNLRATVTSVSIFGIEVFSLIAYILYGIASRNNGNIAGFKVIGVVAIVTAVAYLIFTPQLLTKRIKQEV